jgi:hypothetical protein
MKNALICFCLGLTATALSAQSTLTTTALQRYFNPVRHSLEASADAMPAEKYSYRLTDGQMTFAEWLLHSAQRNFADCAVLKGEAPPEIEKHLTGMKDKAEVSKVLKDSFTYCETALTGMDDQKASSTPQISMAFLHVIVHNNEIYGNVVGYLRSSGIVPPSTAARSNQKKQ